LLSDWRSKKASTVGEELISSHVDHAVHRRPAIGAPDDSDATRSSSVIGRRMTSHAGTKLWRILMCSSPESMILIRVIQRELKTQMEQNNLKVDKCSKEQLSFISMQLLEDEEKSIGTDSASLGTKNCPS
jgi:hypothetical protein